MKTEDEIISLLNRDYTSVGYHLKELWMAANAEDRKRLQEAFPERFEDRTCKWRSTDEEFPTLGVYWDSEGRICEIHVEDNDKRVLYLGTEYWDSLEDEKIQNRRFYGPLVPPKVSE